MRLVQLYSHAWLRAGVESVGIALASVCVALLLTQQSFEARAVIKPGTPNAQDSMQLVQQLRRAVTAVNARSAVVASVHWIAMSELHVSCRSEQPLLARRACEEIAGGAAKPPHRAQLFPPPPTPGEGQPSYYPLLGVLLGCLWFAIRLRQSHQRRALVSDPDLEGWRVGPRGHSDGGNADDDVAVSTSDMRALSTKRPANEASFSELESDTTLYPRLQLRTAANHETSTFRSQDTGPSPRIIFRVGGNPFEPDLNVLTDATIAQLHDVCTQLLGTSLRQRVVRIASGVSSRYAKTQVAAQLSAMLAQQSELPVLLLEADIDAPALHKAMHLEAPLGLGLSEQLQRMLRQGRACEVSLIRVESNLHALVESRTSCPAALGLPQFEELLEQLRALHDFIIVDGPVLDTWPDSEHLSQRIDDIVMVAASGTRLRDTHALMARHFNEDTVLSVVTAGDWSRLTGSI